MIVFLTILLLLLLFAPLYKSQLQPVVDVAYQLKQDYMLVQKKKRTWRFVVQKLEPYISSSLLNKVQKLIRLAGNPWKITASELIIALVLVAAGAILLSTQIQNARVEFTLACFLLIAMPFTRLNKLKNKRQLEARTAIRFLKRRLNTQLKMGIPLDQALEEISSYAPGEFGSVFNDAVSQLTGQNRRSLKEVMQDLRLQYEVKELDSFCLSLELSDMKTMTILREQLDRQISEEAHRIDEFIEERSENVKPKLLSLATLTFLFSVSLAGYFVFAYLKQNWNSGGGFFFGL